MKSRGPTVQATPAMKRVVGDLRQASDWSDFGRAWCLRESLDRPGNAAPSRLLSSPDGRHLLLLWNQPTCQPRLVAFQRLGSQGSDLERSWQPPQPPVAGLLFLASPSTAVSWVLAIIWEQGRTELWRFLAPVGWQLLQSLELCHGAHARIVSICSWGGCLVWCEERPPLGAQLTPERKAFRYCICTRTLQIGDQGAHLSPLRIVLHNCPVYHLLASPTGIFLMPTLDTFPAVAKFVLIWRPERADIAITAPTRGCFCTRALHPGSEVDFKKLVLGYVGLLPSMAPLGVHSCALASSRGLLLLSQTGAVDLVQPNGVWRPIFDFGENAMAPRKQAQLKVYGDTLACLLGGVLYLVDLDSRELIGKKVLGLEVIFLEFHTEEEIQLFAPNGIYTLDFSSTDEDKPSEPILVEMVFEEACKYYQRRTLSSSPLTVEKLKKGEKFQVPIALSSILCHTLASKEKRSRTLPDPYIKLLGAMQLELQSYQNLEFLKLCVVRASESEVGSYGEELVEQELSRLLHLDLNRENLAYLNAIFSSFPGASWKAIQNHLHLQQNGDGLLVARATSDIWRKILGGPVSGLCKQEEVSLNGVVSLFELICLSLYQFKPKWLPQFVKLSQEYVGASWTYSSNEGPEGGVPLYKRALAVLTRNNSHSVEDREMEIELLFCSQRPKAILQAMDLLIQHENWPRVMEAAEKFSMVSPLLNKEIFILLLGEFAQHRALDQFLDTLWRLCPADLSASDILSILQQHLASNEVDPHPFPSSGASCLTIGLLKPLLHRLAQCSSSQHEDYADVLQGPTFPPPTPPRDRVPSEVVSDEGLSPFQNHT